MEIATLLPDLVSLIICLKQIGKHSGMDLTIQVKGDLEVDEHHTIEDTAIALGIVSIRLWEVSVE